MPKLRAAKSSPFGWDHTDCSVLPFSPNDPDGMRVPQFPIGCEGAVNYKDRNPYPAMCRDEVVDSSSFNHHKYKWYKACCKVEGNACIPRQRWGADSFADANNRGVLLSSKTYLSACRKYGGSGDCQYSSKHVFDKIQYGGCACHESQIPQVYADLNIDPVMCSSGHEGAGNNFGTNSSLPQAWCGTLKGACKDGDIKKFGGTPGGNQMSVHVQRTTGYQHSALGKRPAFLNVEEISYQACGGNQDGANVYTGYVAQLATHKRGGPPLVPDGTRIPEPCAPGYRNALSKHECKRLTAAAGLTFVDNPDALITAITHARGCVKVAVEAGQDEPFAKGPWHAESSTDRYDDRVMWVEDEPTTEIVTAFRLCGKVGSAWGLDERAIRDNQTRHGATLGRQQNRQALAEVTKKVNTVEREYKEADILANLRIDDVVTSTYVDTKTKLTNDRLSNLTNTVQTDFKTLQEQVLTLEKISDAAKIRNKSWLTKLLLDLNNLLNHRCTDPNYPTASVDSGGMKCLSLSSGFQCPVGCAKMEQKCVEPDIKDYYGRNRTWGCDILPRPRSINALGHIAPLGCPGAVGYVDQKPYRAMCKAEGDFKTGYKWYEHCCDWINDEELGDRCQPKSSSIIGNDKFVDGAYQECKPPTGSLAATVAALRKQIDKAPSGPSAAEKDYAETNHTHSAITSRVTKLETDTAQAGQAAPLDHKHMLETSADPSTTANAGVTAAELLEHKESIRSQLEQQRKERSEERTKLQKDLLKLTTHTFSTHTKGSGDDLTKFIDEHEELKHLTTDGTIDGLKAAIKAQIDADVAEEAAEKTILEHIAELNDLDLEALRQQLNIPDNNIEDIAAGVLADAEIALQAITERLQADLKDLQDKHGGTAADVAKYIAAHAELAALSGQHVQTFEELRAAIEAKDSAVVRQLKTTKTELDISIQKNLNDISATLIKIGINADDIEANKTAIGTNTGQIGQMRNDLDQLHAAVCQPTDKDFSACRAVTILQRQLAALTELDAAQATQLAEAVSTLENDLYQERGVYNAKLWGWGLVVGIVVLIAVGLLGYYLWSRYRA